MVITAREIDPETTELECWYGPCSHTSARLISENKQEFAYGRFESRLRVPQGAGIWPAFWMLGNNFREVGWPQTGEIDIMEFVGRLPNEIFGTIHGPGYSGGASFGGIVDLGEPVYNEYHTFTVEWEPEIIRWYLDGELYHTAQPSDVAPNEWVFDHPFFLLLNVAVGGNFGGDLGPDLFFPQTYHIDYVRVYQAPDTAERFQATFVDDFTGWQQIMIPWEAFERSANQPDGAPNDGLTLSEVWGYGIKLPAESSGTYRFDQVRLMEEPFVCSDAITVMNVNDNGDGSLRQAIADLCADGVITFDAVLSGQTIVLTSGQLVIGQNMTIDGSDAAGVTVSGNNATRVFEIAGGVNATLRALIIRDGQASPQGGGIRNFGTLTVEDSTVTNNAEVNPGPANFEFGGGGIYNGDGATLNLIRSTVSDNRSENNPGGGVYGFFNSTLNITDSTISGNVAEVDVAGGIRSLGNATIVNSTISGNVSTAWHGGGIFHTDGLLEMTNSTVTDNFAPAGTAAGIVVATFAPGSPTVTLRNTIVANNIDGLDCVAENFAGSGAFISDGHNIDSDGTCNLSGVNDQPNTDPRLGPLDDNGGSTQTHALLAGSPALDAGNDATCPTADQRGVVRPQGASCDIGSVESQIINDALTLSGQRTAYDRTPVEGAPAGVFTISADFTNTSGDTLRSIFFQVVTLTNGNVLLNADGGPGGEGSGITVDLGEDGELAVGETVTVDFLIGLAVRRPFDFFVNAHGVMVDSATAAALDATHSSIRVHSGPLDGERLQYEQIFLPMVSGQ